MCDYNLENIVLSIIKKPNTIDIIIDEIKKTGIINEANYKNAIDDDYLETIRKECKKLKEENNIKDLKIKDLERELNSKTRNYDDKLKDITEQLKNKDIQLGNYSNEVDRFKSANKQLEELLESKKEDIQKEKLQKEELFQKCSDYKHKVESLSEDIRNNIKILKEKDDEISNLKKENSIYMNQFKDARQAYKVFNELTLEIHEKLIEIFRGDKIENIVYSGVQKKTIDSLWEYMSFLVSNKQYEELIKLNKIFNFLIKAYNSIYERPVFAFQQVNIGEKYDEELYSRSSESRMNGIISKIYITGYYNIDKKEIIRKSVVRVE